VSQGVIEFFVGPIADAGFQVGRDVRRNDDAERRLDRPSTGERLTLVLIGVTGPAVGERRKLAAALNLRKVLGVAVARKAARCRSGC
jgi:hypothetical protein